MRSKSFFLFAIGVLLFAAAGINAQGFGDRNAASNGPDEGRYAIDGKVVMPDGTPAKYLRVTYTSTRGDNNTTQTDSEGMFRFDNIPSGNYTVTARTEGFQPATETVVISREGSMGQSNRTVLYIRAEGQKKGAFPPSPLLKDVPKEAVAKFEKALEKAAKNDAKAALPLLDEAIALHARFALAYYEKGVIYQKQNDLDNALTSFTKALEIKPDYLEAKMNYGLTLLAMKNNELAAAVFQDVMKQKADMPSAYSNFGIAMLRMGKTDIAEKAFKYTMTLKGGDSLPAAHLYLGGIYLQRKQNAEAIVELQKYLDLMPNASDAPKIKATIEELKKKG
jgi:Tfp pilus assembly protein PilF